MLEEPPSVVTEREKLNRSIKLLQESKDVVAKILGCISASGQGYGLLLCTVMCYLMSCFWFLDLV